ncbi:DUF2141 domain-containing protein [Rhodocista pekingensis]|uniref:DUF2141 domain-containing protein n=1 Tax=Rhodocista pekingensis TaxID=201185 RepID=A0ABW2KTZ7_9PROT
MMAGASFSGGTGRTGALPALALLLTAGALSAGLAPAASATQLTLTVTNLATLPDGGRGEILVQVFDSAGAYGRGTGPVAQARLRPEGDRLTAPLADLPPGRYLIRVIQDLNGNARLDTGLFGIPREPFGFSNDAIGRMGPPSFEAAAIPVGDQPVTAAIALRR